ncbi:hypothetical protein B0H11DRAFT_2376189 [Mycena galericulata]|nr:hypothetical protein B0H11DRAFT_2376189 [Mycena galericulata]
MKMESGSAKNRRAGIRAGDEVRRDPRVIPEEGREYGQGPGYEIKRQDESDLQRRMGKRETHHETGNKMKAQILFTTHPMKRVDNLSGGNTITRQKVYTRRYTSSPAATVVDSFEGVRSWSGLGPAGGEEGFSTIIERRRFSIEQMQHGGDHWFFFHEANFEFKSVKPAHWLNSPAHPVRGPPRVSGPPSRCNEDCSAKARYLEKSALIFAAREWHVLLRVFPGKIKFALCIAASTLEEGRRSDSFDRYECRPKYAGKKESIRRKNRVGFVRLR